MQTYAKKKIEILVEAPLLKKLIGLLDARRISGYSVLPVLAGRGHQGCWEATGLTGEAGRVVAVFCIVDRSELDPLLKDVFPLILQQIGIVTVSDVEVIRSDHF